MKKLFSLKSLCFIALFSPISASAIDTASDGTYIIRNGNDILEFANIVNAGNLTANAILDNDIDMTGIDWTPIGQSTSLYAGTFDGNNHSIKNFEYTVPTTAKKEGYGLFGATQNAVIKNFNIYGNLTAVGEGNGVVGRVSGGHISDIHSYLDVDCATYTSKQIGGVLGRVTDNAVIERCSYWGEMSVGGGSTDCYGGIAGYASSGADFSNCANYGTLSATVKCYLGGIIGYFNDMDVCVYNCLNTGDIDSSSENAFCSAIVGYSKAGSFDAAHFHDNYYLFMSAPGAIVIKDDAPENEEFAKYATYDELTNGNVTYQLNGNSDGDDIEWYQTLGDDGDEFPVLYRNHGVVSFDGEKYYNLSNGICNIENNNEANIVIYDVNGVTKRRYQHGVNIVVNRSNGLTYKTIK